MAVITNLSVLLSARVENYRSGIGFARKTTDEFSKSAARAGLTSRQAGQALDLLRDRSFGLLSVQDKLKEEINAINHLFKSGIVDQQNHARAVEQVKQAYAQAGLKEAAADQERLNKAIEKGLAFANPQLAQQESLKNKYRETLTSLNLLSSSGRAKELGISSQEISRLRGSLFDDLQAGLAGRITPSQEKANADKLASETRKRIDAENLSAIDALQTAEQRRYSAMEQLRSDELAGLSREAAARRKAAIDANFDKNSGGAALRDLRETIQNRYNEAVQRGVQIANAAKVATDQYRQTVKDVSKALVQAKISQDQFNNAKLAAKRQREDSSLDPIVKSGVQAVAPYKQVVTEVTRKIEDMRAALKAGKVSQEEYDAAFRNGLAPIRQYKLAVQELRAKLKSGELSQREFARATREAKTEILGQTSALQRLLSGFGVMKTVLVGLASAKLFGAVFEGISDGFAFEPKIRTAIAKFRNVTKEQEEALRNVVINSTNNNVPLLERAQALEELAKDGVAANVAIQSLQQTLKFASVASLPVGESVSLVSEVVNSYGLKTDDANLQTVRLYQTMDLLSEVSLQTASDVQQTAQALIRFAPEADQLGVSMREAAAGVVAFSELGIKGEVAGNEFAIALRDLKNNAIENEQAFKDLKVEVFDSFGNFRGVSNVVTDLDRALDGLSAREKAVALATLGTTQKGAKFQQQLVTMIDVLRTAKTGFEDTKFAVDELHRRSLTELEIATNRVRTGFANLVNNTVVAFLEKVAGYFNSITLETRRTVAAFAAFAATFYLVTTNAGFLLGLIPALIAGLTKIISLMKSGAVVAAFLSGVTGNWKNLALGLGAAAVAAGVMYYSYDRLEGLFYNTDSIAEARQQLDLFNDTLNSGTGDVDDLRNIFIDALEGIGAAADENLSGDKFKDDAFKKIKERANELQRLAQQTDIEGLKNAKTEVDTLINQINNFKTFDPKDTKLVEQAYKNISSQIDRIVNSMNKIKNPFNPEELQRYRNELEGIKNGTTTPLEQSLVWFQNLRGIKQSIGIDKVTEGRQVGKLFDEAIKQLQSGVANATSPFNTAAATANSSADFSARYRVGDSGGAANERRQQHAEQLRELRRSNFNLETLVSKIAELVEQSRVDEESTYPEY